MSGQVLQFKERELVPRRNLRSDMSPHHSGKMNSKDKTASSINQALIPTVVACALIAIFAISYACAVSAAKKESPLGNRHTVIAERTQQSEESEPFEILNPWL